ncbi:hypothetical protein FRB91_006359 [Serendipita sp. 411]|nr:hypothetical protein FRC18_009437 [Serendipita sp. 400]KAG8852574.1 hypothetical protein FRB91_006359 [Serendipita sp. 411]
MEKDGGPAGIPKEITDSAIWETYESTAVPRDKEMLEECAENLDGLLLYAGLLSAILTAFIALSIQLLQEDTQETSILLLLSISQQLNNASSPSFVRPAFEPSKYAVAINGCFFASLVCSLLSSFGAILILQWISAYSAKLTSTMSVRERALRRHFRYLGFTRWRIQSLSSLLPSILILAVLLFFFALTLWAWEVNKTIGVIVLVGGVCAALFYIVTAFLGTMFLDSPFKGPATALFYPLQPFLVVSFFVVLVLIPSLLEHFIPFSWRRRLPSWGMAVESAFFSALNSELEVTSSASFQSEVVSWIMTQIEGKNDYLLRLLDYTQTRFLTKGKGFEDKEVVEHAASDISWAIKVLVDKCYDQTVQLDKWDDRMLPILVRCAATKQFPGLNYNRDDDKHDRGTSGLLGDLSMIENPTEEEVKVIVQIATLRQFEDDQSRALLKELCKDGSRGDERRYSDRLLQYAMRRLRVYIVSMPCLQWLEGIDNIEPYDKILALDDDTDRTPEEIGSLAMWGMQRPWFLQNIAKGERLGRLLRIYAADSYEEEPALCKMLVVLFPLLRNRNDLKMWLEAVQRSTTDQAAPGTEYHERLVAIKKSIDSLRTSPPENLSPKNGIEDPQEIHINTLIRSILDSPSMSRLGV